MAFTAVPNTPAITLLPTGPGGSTSLNPVYTQCDPTNGNYFATTNRDLVSFYLFPAAEFAPSWLATTTYTYGQVVNFAGSVATITQIAITTNVLTVTAANVFTAGAQALLDGLTTATFLNGVTVTVTGSNGSTFTATYAHANYGPAADTGTATVAAGIFIASNSSSQTNLNVMPSTVGYWEAYVDADATVTLYSAPDICTGRKSDVDNYQIALATPNVPPASAADGAEFLVLPSSVFTQANGQFQFLASSSLVYVYVRNL